MARIIASNTVPGARVSSSPGRQVQSEPVERVIKPPIGLKLTPPPTKSQPPGIPILMHDQVTVAPGGEQPMSSKAFLNTRSKSISLRTLSLTLSLVPVAGFVGASFFMLGGTIAFQLALVKKSGKTIPITRGYVPSWCFCRSDSRPAEEILPFLSFTLSAQKWRFSLPIVLDPGDMLSAQVKHLGTVNLSATVDMSFAGSDAAFIGRRRLPYTTYWQSRDFTYSDVGIDSTPKDALLNDTGVDLLVDRIIGRFASSDQGGPGGLPEFADYADITDQSANYATLRINLAQNRAIIRDFTSFRAAFGTNAALETSFLMAPQDQLIADVQHLAGDALSAASPIGYFRGRAFVSLVGSREI